MVINRNKSKRITTQFRLKRLLKIPQKSLTTSTIFSLMWGQLLLEKFLTATKIRMIISKLVSWTPFLSSQHAKRRMKIYCIDSKIAQLDGMPFSLSISKLWDNTLKDLWPTSVISHSKLDFFPHELKIANGIPIYKNSEEYFFTNYRPVSVLPIFLPSLRNTHVPKANNIYQ